MGKYNGAVITTAGTNVISQAISGTELTWTVMRSSSVAIPEGVKTIANGAFSGCTLLSRVDLPASLRTVEENAFLGCDALTTVIYDGPPKYFTSIYFGRGNETLVGVYLMGK